MKLGFEEAKRERDALKAYLATTSTRSGFNLEKLVLNVLKNELIQENIDRSKISQINLIDKEGDVYFKNYSTDIDVLFQDGKTILMEIKATADNRDIYDLLRKAKLYELQMGVKPDKLILACLEINRTNFKQAIKQDVNLIAGQIT
ncbi:MAG: hypothetical protein BAJALOKI1v1_2340004 [Promethearchaeota archaeon]|nr:MAG: hypothetical protein BAJALOKI1v1_2340004 [Candidatus Lokiarchaeota archaeon]